MVQILFYEKPGCINNTRQKKLLAEAGHVVDARNLLTETWRFDSLRPFFQGLAVKDWFNQCAPAVKSGQVKPETLDEEGALALMLQEPLLIRRPLMMIDAEYFVGFDVDRLSLLIDLVPIKGSRDLEIVHAIMQQVIVKMGRRTDENKRGN